MCFLEPHEWIFASLTLHTSCILAWLVLGTYRFHCFEQGPSVLTVPPSSTAASHLAATHRKFNCAPFGQHNFQKRFSQVQTLIATAVHASVLILASSNPSAVLAVMHIYIPTIICSRNWTKHKPQVTVILHVIVWKCPVWTITHLQHGCFSYCLKITALTPCMQQAYAFQLPSNSHCLQRYLDLSSKIPGVLLLSITTYDLKLSSFSQSKAILTEDFHWITNPSWQLSFLPRIFLSQHKLHFFPVSHFPDCPLSALRSHFAW